MDIHCSHYKYHLVMSGKKPRKKKNGGHTTVKQKELKKVSKSKLQSNKKVSTPLPCDEKVVYLDSNGTTQLCAEAKVAMIKWLTSKANPSSSSVIATNAKKLLDEVRRYIQKQFDAKKYTVIFTSGASESNCFILRSAADAFKHQTGRKPHIITSATEHKSIIECCNSLKDYDKADITYIEPNAYGCINVDFISQAITENTCLISIIAANNELGCVNDIVGIGKLAHSKNIPFHTDAVQLFGRYKMSLKKYGIDALSMSFHKLYGPMGLGLLILSNELIKGYDMPSQISGNQQDKLRGGTENVPAIAGAYASLKRNFADRSVKNEKMLILKTYLVDSLKKHLPQGTYRKYFTRETKLPYEFIVLGPLDFRTCKTLHYTIPKVLPNTLLLSFVKNKGDPFCNVKLKKYLDKNNIIVSIGSACSTSSKKASHVLYAIKAPDKVKRGVMRVSLCDNTTKADIDKFIKVLIMGLKKQIPWKEIKMS